MDHGVAEPLRTGPDLPPGSVAYVRAGVGRVDEVEQVLARQRDRWHRGLAEVLLRHLGLAFNVRYGAMGVVAVPYFLLVELLAPVVEIVGVLAVVLGFALGVVDVRFALLFVVVAYGCSLALTVFTLALGQWT